MASPRKHAWSGRRSWPIGAVCLLAVGSAAAAPDRPAAAALAPPPDVAAPPPDAEVAASGIASKVLRRGQGGERPAANDCVKLHFSGWTRGGTMLSDSRRKRRGEPALQCVRTAMPGIAEALQAMQVGELRRVWIPAGLGFPSDDEHPAPGVGLTFDLELIERIPAPPTPTDLKAAPEEARRLRSGVGFRLLKQGAGKRRPSPSSRVRLHFSGWTRDGRLVESTTMGGRPVSSLVSEAPRGWREGLQEMVEGDTARFWIPAALAYGAKPKRRSQPAGDLVYDIELLSVEVGELN